MEILRSTTKDQEFYDKWKKYFYNSELLFLLVQRFNNTRLTLGEEYCSLQRQDNRFIWTFLRCLIKSPLIEKCLRIAFLLQIIPSPLLGVKYKQDVNHPSYYHIAGWMSLASVVLDYVAQLQKQKQSIQNHQADLKSRASCILCEENPIAYGQAAVTKCGHVFHYGCIQDWLYEHPFCPVCRNKSQVFIKLLNL